MEWFEIFDISLFRSLIRSATPIALIGFGGQCAQLQVY